MTEGKHTETYCMGFDRGKEAERERITKLLLERLEYFDCDICGECVTPTRLAEMIMDK